MWGNSNSRVQGQGQGHHGQPEVGDGNGEPAAVVGQGQYSGSSVVEGTGQLTLHQRYQQQQQQQQQQDMPTSSTGEDSSPWNTPTSVGSSTSASASVHYNYEFNCNASAAGSTGNLSSHHNHSPGSSNGNGMERNDDLLHHHQHQQRPATSPPSPSYLQSRPSTSNGYRTAPNYANYPSYAIFNGGCNLIINYIPQFFTDRNLYDLFIPFGIIMSVKVMKDRKTGYSFGFGFVNYEKEHAAQIALYAMNGSQVQNKRLKVSFARPASEEIKNTNLYITSIPRNWNEQNMYNLFARYGEIVHLNLLRDQRGESRGVAFVRYAYRWEADRAIKELHLMKPEGAQDCIKVRLAEDHGKQKAAFMAGFELASKKNSLGRFRNEPFGLGWNTPEPHDNQNINMDELLQAGVHPLVSERRQRRQLQQRQFQQQQQQLQHQQQMHQPAEFQPSFPVFENAPVSPPHSSETPRRTLQDQLPSTSSSIYYK